MTRYLAIAITEFRASLSEGRPHAFHSNGDYPWQP